MGCMLRCADCVVGASSLASLFIFVSAEMKVLGTKFSAFNTEHWNYLYPPFSHRN